MAGRPKRRARLQAAGEIPEAVEGAPGHDARTRARARVHGVEPGYVGPKAKAAADRAASDELEHLAHELRPNTVVRVERLRPTWCAGWVEDYVIDLGGLADLYAHLKSEWGGQVYSCRVLLSDGTTAFTSRLAVAGPPKNEGRIINRESWSGEAPASRPATPAPAPSAGGADLSALGQLMALFAEQNARVLDSQMSNMRELVSSSAAQNQNLIQAIADRDGERNARQSFAGQLGELIEATEALEHVRGALAPREDNPTRMDDSDPMAAALKEATGRFLGNAMGSMLTRPTPGTQRGGAQRRPSPTPPGSGVRRASPRAPNRKPASGGGDEIPDAIPGQTGTDHRR